MYPNPQFPADLVTFTEEIINEKVHFLCSDININATRADSKESLLCKKICDSCLDFKNNIPSSIDTA